MNTLTLLVLAALALWLYKPLRVFLIQRTNRAVKVALVVFPLLFIGRLVWRLVTGAQDDSDVVALTVAVLLLAWGSLVWLTGWLERRRPTPAQAPDLTVLSRLPGVPRVPDVAQQLATSPQVRRAAQQLATSPQVRRAAQQLATSPQVRRAAQAAASAAASADWGDVAAGVGRTSGRLFARLKKSMGPTSPSGPPSAAPLRPPSQEPSPSPYPAPPAPRA
jgi:hypothetical protein